MPKSFTFNGVKKPWIYALAGRSKPPFAALKRNILTVPSMPGAYLQSTDVDTLVISQPVGFVVQDDAHALQLKDELATWLITDEPAPLQFDDEPNRTYYAVVQNTLDDFEKFARLRTGTIQFLCVDPYGYGPERLATFPSDLATLTNQGTAPADPIFEMEVLQPTTMALVQNQNDEYMMLGRPLDADTEPFEAEELILHNTMSTLNGWTAGNQVDDGAVAGRFATDGNEFRAADYGTGGAKWYGPALKTSIPEALQDFRAELLITHLNTGSPDLVGRVEMYLLDANSNIIGRISMRDAWENLKRNRADAYMRNPVTNERHYTITIREVPTGATGDPWFDFRGVLRLQRIGNRWSSYVAKIGDDGVHYARETRIFDDRANKFMDKVAQIQIHIGKFGQHPTAFMRIRDLKVWKINNPDDHQIPYIAYPGDTITFDHKNAELLINGEDRTDLKDFGGTYFKLKKGQNNLVVQPDNTFNTRLRYRERYR